MYASYFYKAGATETDIFNDIIAILTGETNVNNLSASCDKANTTIVPDFPTNWTVEATTGTNRKVLSSPHSQDPTRKKYVAIEVSGGLVKLALVRGVSGTTEVNPLQLADGYMQEIDTTNGGRLDIFVDDKTIGFFSYINGNYKNSNFIFEVELDDFYQNAGWGAADANLILIDILDLSGNPVSWDWMPPTTIKPLKNYSDRVEVQKILFTRDTRRIFNFATSDVFQAPDNFGAVFDTIDIQGKRYVVWPFTSTLGRILVPMKLIAF